MFRYIHLLNYAVMIRVLYKKKLIYIRKKNRICKEKKLWNFCISM
jgi:hypothetical protein